MENEVEPIGEDNLVKHQPLVKAGLRKLPANHRSVDDMEFDDIEYKQLKVRDELAHKHKQLREENEKDEMEEKNKLKEAVENGEEESDSESEEDEEIEKDDSAEFESEKWVAKFEQICEKLDKKLIGLKEFEKAIRALMVYLDPSKDEKNKERLCLLAEHLVVYYQSLFNLKSAGSAIDMGVIDQCTNFIYELFAKYGSKSTKEQPSIFISLFRKILGELNSQYVGLKWNEKKFPQLNTVHNDFLFIFDFFKIFI